MLFTPSERGFAKAHSRFLFLNPLYHPESRSAYDAMMSVDLDQADAEAAIPPLEIAGRAWIGPMVRRAEALLAALQQRLATNPTDVSDEERRWYGDLTISSLYFRWFSNLDVLNEAGDGSGRVESFKAFAGRCRELTNIGIQLEPFFYDHARIFAIFSQLQRAFVLIQQLVQGNSRPVARLRAAIWYSIFPHDLRVYGTLLYERMHEITTLILGPSGTGKELVATSIGLSRYVPFDSKRERFSEKFAGACHPINLSAMPKDLIESEMFGHRAGSFTGASSDRQGWFEKCGPRDAVFLDEIGELDPAIQVKLLRLLQNREFYRVGETDPRSFRGRIIAATNRNLGHEIGLGRFRQDLYYRLCTDVIQTPTLREQLDDCPEDLPFLVQMIASKCLGEQAQPEQVEWLTNLSLRWIEKCPELGLGYDWPGNFRELEQCVRSAMIRGEYHPPTRFFPSVETLTARPASQNNGNSPAIERFLAAVRRGGLTYDALLEHYCSLIFSRSDNLTDAARRLDKHRATVESRVIAKLVDEFRNG